MENNTSLQQQLLEAGVHFGHLRKKWNPKMLPYIFAEKKGIHIIDLNKTTESLQEATAALKQIARSGKKIMFVGTKKQAKEIVTECAKKINMPFVTERWLGGMLTNFNTVRKSVKKMQSIEKMLTDGSFDPRELTINRFNAWYGEPEMQQSTLFANAGNTLGNGVDVIPNGGVAVGAVLDHVTITDTQTGLQVLDSGTATVTNSNISYNVARGILAGSAGGPTVVNLDRSTIAGNANGGIVATPNTTVRISNVSVYANNVGLKATGTGAIISFGNNTIGPDAGNAGLPTATVSQH